MSGTALEKKELCEDPVELMRIYKQTGDLEVRNQLVLHYMDSVKKTVMSMRYEFCLEICSMMILSTKAY